MTENILEKRKKKITEFFKSNIFIIQYVILMIIIWVGAKIRMQPLNKLIDITTGKPISLELDSTLFLRYAQYISEHGKLFINDGMRFYPLGGDINIGIFSAYFTAYTHKILNLFTSISIEMTNNIYPIISMIILSIFLFLLVRRLFDWRVGLLATFFINIIPTFLFRSVGGSSDHDILGITLMIMVLYFFVVSWQHKNKIYKVLMSVISGFLVLIGLNTAGTILSSLIIIGIFFLVEIILNKIEDDDIYSLVPFTITITLLVPFLTNLSFSGFIVSSSTIFLNTAVISLLILKYIKLKNIKTKLPNGIVSVISTLLIAGVILSVFFGIDFVIAKIKDIFSPLLKNSFSVNRWILTVAENKRPYVIDWFQNFGKYYVFAFIIGSIVLFYDALKKFKRVKELTVIYSIFIFSYIFSRYSFSSRFNGESNIANLLFFGSIILFFGTIIVGYLYLYYKKHDEFESISNIDKKYAFVLIWFFIMILAATSAIRLFFEFTPITVILFSFLIFYIIDYFWNKNLILKYAAIALILLFLFSPFSFARGIAINYYDTSFSTANALGPGYNQQWQRTGAWVRNNTPENSTFIHWWDYGYWVQSGFQRRTVTDGGNFFGWWNYLTGREVLTTPDIVSSLKFLKAHDVDYLLIVSDEIGKYPAYSSIGSDINYDRFSNINTFSFAPNQIEKTRNSTVLVFNGVAPFDEPIQLSNGPILPQGASGVVSVKFPITIDESTGSLSSIGQPTAVVAYNNQGISIPMRCLFFDKTAYEFENYALDSCFRIIPSFNADSPNGNPFGGGLYLSRRVYHSLFGQLYLLNKESDYYKLVYEDNNDIPLALINGNLIGPQKIWKINYPNDLNLSNQERKYYLRTDYPDDSLLKP